jgi:hypothetical protein
VNAEQAALDFHSRSWAEKRTDEYRASLSQRAQSTALHAARIGDPDGHALAVRTIRRLIFERGTVTADDVQAETPIQSNAIGSAFAALSRAGEIRVTGYTTSQRPAAHGRIQRVWGRSP